jgi:hypothetical protein
MGHFIQDHSQPVAGRSPPCDDGKVQSRLLTQALAAVACALVLAAHYPRYGKLNLEEGLHQLAGYYNIPIGVQYTQSCQPEAPAKQKE